MKTLQFFIILFLLTQSTLLKAQSPKDNVLGHYTGLERVTNTNTSGFSDCFSAIYNIKAPASYPSVIIEDTSCLVTGGAAGNFIVYDDSTIRNYWTQTYINGQLYPNDSLYFKWWYACCPEVQVEFFGFKQYGFPAPIGINEKNANSVRYLLYPNPVSNIINVVFPDAIEEMDLQVLDINGKLVLEQHFKTSTQIDVADLPKGVYVVRIKGTSVNLSKRVVLVN